VPARPPRTGPGRPPGSDTARPVPAGPPQEAEPGSPGNPLFDAPGLSAPGEGPTGTMTVKDFPER